MAKQVQLADSVQAIVRSQFGVIKTITPLSAYRHNRVWRVDCETKRVIVKLANQVEIDFYLLTSSRLTQCGVPVPALYAHQDNFLIIEYIPHALPQARWGADPAIVTYLRALHECEVEAVGQLFQPKWTHQTTRDALTCLQLDDIPMLDSLREQAQSLFVGDGLISADPNPKNWGIRHNGDIVLFDWERFTRGNPAIDLAIIVPRLGTYAQYEQIALMYPGTSVVEMLIARAWTIVELLATIHTEQLDAQGTVQWLRHSFPIWLHDHFGK